MNSYKTNEKGNVVEVNKKTKAYYEIGCYVKLF